MSHEKRNIQGYEEEAFGGDKLSYLLHTVDLQTEELMETARSYAAQPDEEKSAAIIKNAQILTKDFSEVIKAVLETDESMLKKIDMAVTLVEGEAEKRVEKFNEIIGEKIIVPGLMINYIEDADDITNEQLFNKSVEGFQGFLSAEISKLTDIVEDSFDEVVATEVDEASQFDKIRVIVLEKTKDVTTLAGSVAVGILIARQVKRKTKSR